MDRMQESIVYRRSEGKRREMIRQEVALGTGVNRTVWEAEAFLGWVQMGGRRMSW